MSELESNHQIFRRIAQKLGMKLGVSSALEKKNLLQMEKTVDELRAHASYEPNDADLEDILRATAMLIKGSLGRDDVLEKMRAVLRDGKASAEVPDFEPEPPRKVAAAPKAPGPDIAIIHGEPSQFMFQLAKRIEPTRDELNAIVALMFECASKTFTAGLNRFRLRSELRERIVTYMVKAMAVHSASTATVERVYSQPPELTYMDGMLPRKGTKSYGITIEWPTEDKHPRVTGMDLDTMVFLQDKRDRLITFRYVPRPVRVETEDDIGL